MKTQYFASLTRTRRDPKEQRDRWRMRCVEAADRSLTVAAPNLVSESSDAIGKDFYTARLPEKIFPGLRFCTSTILRIGIMLLGIRLSLMGAGRFTLVALPFVAVAIVAGLTTVGLLGRYMGLTRRLSGLIAVGTSICGVTAIVAVAPLIKANESEVSYSVACITIFGLAAMFFYPVIGYHFFPDQMLACCKPVVFHFGATPSAGTEAPSRPAFRLPCTASAGCDLSF